MSQEKKSADKGPKAENSDFFAATAGCPANRMPALGSPYSSAGPNYSIRLSIEYINVGRN